MRWSLQSMQTWLYCVYFFNGRRRPSRHVVSQVVLCRTTMNLSATLLHRPCVCTVVVLEAQKDCMSQSYSLRKNKSDFHTCRSEAHTSHRRAYFSVFYQGIAWLRALLTDITKERPTPYVLRKIELYLSVGPCGCSP